MCSGDPGFDQLTDDPRWMAVGVEIGDLFGSIHFQTVIFRNFC